MLAAGLVVGVMVSLTITIKILIAIGISKPEALGVTSKALARVKIMHVQTGQCTK
jgi:hypothetical protein